MSNRKRRAPPVQSHKISDKSRLLWERYFGAMNAAAVSLNGAIKNTENIIAGVIIEAEGFAIETHILDTDRLEIRARPRNP